MTLDYTPEALIDLNVIWDWNAQQYGNVHADAYIEFLRRQTDRLDTEYGRGRIVRTASPLRYQLIRRRKKGHGHVVVYEVRAGNLVRILRYFHSARDWQTKLAADLGDH